MPEPGRKRGPRARGRDEPTVADIMAALDQIAPFHDAAEWDNVGLLAGRPEWPGRRWLVALDLTDDVAREALRKDVDGLIVYHPPIFKSIHAVTPDAEGPTALLPDLIAARIAIVSTHTALDAAVGGTNDLLLDTFDTVERVPLEERVDEQLAYKLVVFVPADEVDALRTALSRCGAGVIGHYRECSFELRGRGSFKGDETTNPVRGRKQRLEFVDEARLEMVVPVARRADVIRALYAAHAYEEPAFELYPLHALRGRGRTGMGRVGTLRRPTRGTRLIERLRERIDLSAATIVGDAKRAFRSVTAAAGAFGVRAFREPDSFVITGECKHHDALLLLRRGVAALLAGHYASERLALESIRARVSKAVRGAALAIARSDRAPFRRV